MENSAAGIHTLFVHNHNAVLWARMDRETQAKVKALPEE